MLNMVALGVAGGGVLLLGGGVALGLLLLVPSVDDMT
jgi:hypothetical protein